ncbi:MULTISPECIES: hypothetical protein [Nostoc]|uniref:Uncharacterized protein n=1 Tax=Nostoc paludosum FACHB-159 TaxID=2692908 RepID=A0ABR8K606_9NOSO|nr:MULTISPECIES: hypothetical protein [Nostoc]MBD2677373.1 hypothetical protein [Nostoc sp. FACHB-857]MBD2734234.1 hypothetical protein [Nostoc paludosum FACHB-159]
MTSLNHRKTQTLTQGKGVQLSGNHVKTEKFFIQKTLRDGGRIRFKVRYSAELNDFCLLEIILMNAQTETQVANMTIPNGGSTVKVQEQEQEFSIWESGDYYFFFKMSSKSGTFLIEEYQLYWLIS